VVSTIKVEAANNEHVVLLKSFMGELNDLKNGVYTKFEEYKNRFAGQDSRIEHAESRANR